MFEISNQSNIKAPSNFSKYKEIKEMVLGKSFDLSVCFIDPKKSKKINKDLRKKNKPANVLSFCLDKNSGEVLINLDTKKEARKFNMSHKKYIAFLLIHGCLHIKGFDHGEKMDLEEKKFLKKIKNL
ncbi:MAG TPA: rRNA maturation RNase YbeY [Candidatus Paceibacterota bacterium]|nr:rRNA maturation RNase YbeY [Candidatus Paceibacterota bacterium]HMP18842.1 rRNA maturation RNase YbeY [Candidatus Paceibacterota bacterium]HMP85366.1 rRNA maturation RNase YbeY [Candidatus Paceibacterota bacterium]